MKEKDSKVMSRQDHHNSVASRIPKKIADKILLWDNRNSERFNRILLWSL